MSKYDYINMYNELVYNGDKHNVRLLVKYLEDYIRYDVEYDFKEEHVWDEEEEENEI